MQSVKYSKRCYASRSIFQIYRRQVQCFEVIDRDLDVIVYQTVSVFNLGLKRDVILCNKLCHACSSCGRGSPENGLSTIWVSNRRVTQWMASLAGTSTVLIMFYHGQNMTVITWKGSGKISVESSIFVE